MSRTIFFLPRLFCFHTCWKPKLNLKIDYDELHSLGAVLKKLLKHYLLFLLFDVFTKDFHYRLSLSVNTVDILFNPDHFFKGLIEIDHRSHFVRPHQN